MQNAASVAPAVWEGGIVWEVSGKPISVRLSRNVVDRLGIAVQEGFKSLPRRGLETGGLLIGLKREAGNRVVIDVNDFEPVESEHAAGPSYLLSDADRRLLAARIAAREGGVKSSSIVGFYRSHTRRDFAMTMEDAAVFSTYFRKASDVFLLIKSNDGSPPTGGFIIREGGKVLSDRPYVQFPLERTAISSAVRETPVVDLQSSLTPAGLAAPQALQALPLSPQRHTRVVRLPVWFAIVIATALAVGVPFGIQRLTSGSMPAKPGRSLALNVVKTGDTLRLSWNRPSPLYAGQAVLWIKDGQQEQKFELDANQLGEGSVAYWPSNGDVTFRLDLKTPGGNVSESVRAIGGPSRALLAIPASAVVGAATSPKVSAAASPAVGAAASPAVGAAASPAVAAPVYPSAMPAPVAVTSPNPQRRNRTGTAPVQRSRIFALPQPERDRTMAVLPALPDPPTIQPMGALPLEHSKEVLERIAPANSLRPRESADSSLRVIAEPVSASRVGRNIPLIGKRNSRGDYVPPVPVRNAAVPEPSHRKVAQEVKIDVKVYVNSSGKVEYSEVLSKVAKTDRDLASLAMFAARRWEFIPARSGKDTVPGEVILHYHFAPGAGAGRNQGFPAR